MTMSLDCGNSILFEGQERLVYSKVLQWVEACACPNTPRRQKIYATDHVKRNVYLLLILTDSAK